MPNAEVVQLADYETMVAEVERLREALEKIRDGRTTVTTPDGKYETYLYDWRARAVAREALNA